MTKKEQAYLDRLEENLDQLVLEYNNAKDEIKELLEYIEMLKTHCHDNNIKVLERFKYDIF